MKDVQVGLGTVLRRSSRLRTLLVVVGLVLSTTAGVVYFIPEIYLADDFDDFRNRAAPVLGSLGVAMVAVVVASYNDHVETGVAVELDAIRRERDRIREDIAAHDTDAFRRLELNLNQITEYYTINKSQARNSFRFGVFAVTAGMATLLIAVAMFLSDESGRLTPASIVGVSGVLVEFIGASALYLYNKSLGMLNLFYARLADLQEVMLAVTLCDQMTDDAHKDEIRAQLIRSLFRRSPDSVAASS